MIGLPSVGGVPKVRADGSDERSSGGGVQHEECSLIARGTAAEAGASGIGYGAASGGGAAAGAELKGLDVLRVVPAHGGGGGARRRRRAVAYGALGASFALALTGCVLAGSDMEPGEWFFGKGAKKPTKWEKYSAKTPSATPDGCATTLYVIRHCDKPKDDTDDYGECTETGFERADYIARLWGGDYAGDAAARYDPPALLLARAPTGTGGQGDGVKREAQTLAPLGAALGLEVDTSLHTTSSAEKRLARAIAHGEFCGASVLVCWKHTFIPKLLEELGCGSDAGCPTHWKSKEFDTIVQVDYELTRGKSGKKHDFSWTVSGAIAHEGFSPRSEVAVSG